MVGLNQSTLKTVETDPVKVNPASPRTLLELQRRNLQNLMMKSMKKQNKMNKTFDNGMYFDLDRQVACDLRNKSGMQG